MQCTLYIIHYNMYTVQCTVYSEYCLFLYIFFKLYILRSLLFYEVKTYLILFIKVKTSVLLYEVKTSLIFNVYSVHCILHSVHCILNNV